MMEDLNKKIKEAGYQKLDIYQLSHALAIKVHKMTLSLPQLEMFEEGSQLRRSSKSIPSNIVEGYILRKYKNEFLHYLYRAYASGEETVEHLKLIFETGSFSNEKIYQELIKDYSHLNAMLFKFIQSVEEHHDKPLYVKDTDLNYFI